MASLDGSPIFGVAVEVVTGDPELVRQENKFPGLLGVESLIQGNHGTVSHVKGLLYGTSSANLSAAEGTIRGFRDGVAYVFVDSYGNSWNNVVLEAYTPVDRIFQGSNGYYYRRYTATLRHLTPS